MQEELDHIHPSLMGLNMAPIGLFCSRNVGRQLMDPQAAASIETADVAACSTWDLSTGPLSTMRENQKEEHSYRNYCRFESMGSSLILEACRSRHNRARKLKVDE